MPRDSPLQPFGSMLPFQSHSDAFTMPDTIDGTGLNRRTITWMAVKHRLSPVRVSGSPLGYLLGNYTHWSDCASCVLGAGCASLRLLVNTNPFPHSPNCEWQSILWEAFLHKPTTGFALDFENCQSGLRGVRRELTAPINIKKEEPTVESGRMCIIYLWAT